MAERQAVMRPSVAVMSSFERRLPLSSSNVPPDILGNAHYQKFVACARLKGNDLSLYAKAFMTKLDKVFQLVEGTTPENDNYLERFKWLVADLESALDEGNYKKARKLVTEIQCVEILTTRAYQRYEKIEAAEKLLRSRLTNILTGGEMQDKAVEIIEALEKLERN